MSREIRAIEPVNRVKARIRLPGSKSITHRALLMAALARGESRIDGGLDAEDTRWTAGALEKLGVKILFEGDSWRVTPPARRWDPPGGPLFLGASGTSMRLVAAVAAAGEGRFVLDGAPRLRERPLGPVLDALKSLGVEHRCLEKEGYPPVEISSRGLAGGRVRVDARESSQFLSALLVAAPCAAREMRVEWEEPAASFPYVKMTLAMMERWGIPFRRPASNVVTVPAPRDYRALRYRVEGDASSASYFWAAAALTGGEVFTYPLPSDSLQGDSRFLEVLEEMGCKVRWEGNGVRVRGADALRPLDIDMNAMPDMVPTLAVLAAFARGETRIGNVAHLRIKESDRLRVTASELAKLGVDAEELPDGLVVRGGEVRGAAVEAHDDHRIAMAFAVAGLKAPGMEIRGAEAVSKSFPSFWDLFQGLAP